MNANLNKFFIQELTSDIMATILFFEYIDIYLIFFFTNKVTVN